MAEIVTIASKIGGLLFKPIVRQLRYVCCFHRYVEDLQEEESNLKMRKNVLQNLVEEAKRNAKEIEKYAEKWLEEAEEAIRDVEQLKQQAKNKKHCCSKCCPDWVWRYRLSKKVRQEATKLKKLKEKGDQISIVAYKNPPQAIEFLPNKDFMHSSAVESALKHITEALEDDNVRMIGLYGVGGVGKTTLVKEVGKCANELKSFDSVIMVVVSKTPDLINIQGQIAEKLGFSLQESSKDVRASRLWQRMKSEKRILVILDDVWSNINLKDIGIPLYEDRIGCKILLTTRDQSVCTSMGCQSMIELHELSEHDAWELFKANAGLTDESPLKDIAMEVAKRCKPLPQTIVTIGKALKGKSTNAWNAALKRLKRSEKSIVTNTDEEQRAYARLKSSFAKLNNWETKLDFSLLIAIRSIYNGKYMRYVNEKSEVHGFLKFSADDLGPLTKYEVEPAWCGNGLVHLKSCYNNKYFMRWSIHHWWMVAQADEPEEDVHKWSCTLFQPKFNDELCAVQFIHVQLGHYVCLWRLDEPYGNCLFAGSRDPDQDRCDVYKVFQLDSTEESKVQPI